MTRFGATIFGCKGFELTEQERDFFRAANPFGYILFARNIRDAEQVRALCADLRATVGRNVPILIDQEGGSVQRLRASLGQKWDDPLPFVARAGQYAARAMYLRYRLIAAEMMALGVDANCAPLVDVACENTHAFLKSRCYGTEPETVARLGRAVADGLSDGGVFAVLKHIPGHGRAQSDSHLDLPRVDASLAALKQDFAPFQALNDLSMGMTAHLVYEAYDELPATISTTMMNVIRTEIGFDGLIMTDDISMQALSGTIAERSAASIQAGCDVVLHCNGDFAEMQDVAEASGMLGEIGQLRADKVLSGRKSPNSVDIEALRAELDGLLSGPGNG